MFSKTGDIRECLYFNDCGKKDIYNGCWKEHWYRYNGNFLCMNHYARLINNKRVYRNREYLKPYTDRKIRFLGKKFTLNWNIRTGFCSLCPNNIFDKSCHKTDMHHWFYVPIMVWACTEERCPVCHGEETIKIVNRKRWGWMG